jgi:hypothetical protein
VHLLSTSTRGAASISALDAIVPETPAVDDPKAAKFHEMPDSERRALLPPRRQIQGDHAEQAVITIAPRDYGAAKAAAGLDFTHEAAAVTEIDARSRRRRNFWMLLLTLSRNPALVAHRRRTGDHTART